MPTAPTNHPTWWKDEHTSGWDRVKDAFHRDWEQTKADFSKTSGHELNQNVGDTVKQAAGSAPVPPGNVPNPPKPGATSSKWEDAEPALRYGYGARNHFKDHAAWDDRLESSLRTDWDASHGPRTWDTARDDVRRGWDRAGRG